MTLDTRSRLWVPDTGVGRAPAIIRPSTEVLVHTPMSVGGRWRWELVNRGGEVVRACDWKSNLIVDAGLDAFNVSGAPALCYYCGVGTGSTVPATTQTGLVAPLGSRTASNGGFTDVRSDESNTYSRITTTRVFDFAEANGNLTEVGFFQDLSGGTMWMRQLFLDGIGDPTTVVKTADFQLRIVYEIRAYWYVADETYELLVTGTARNVRQLRDIDYSWTMLPEFATTSGLLTADCELRSAGTFGTAGQSYTGGTAVSSNELVVASYTLGTYYREFTHRWSAAVANTTTWAFVRLGNNGYGGKAVKVDLTNGGESAGVTKDNTQRYVINHRRSWARHVIP